MKDAPKNNKDPRPRTGTLILYYSIPSFGYVPAAIVLVPFFLSTSFPFVSPDISSIDGIPTPLLRYDPSASLWRHTTLHSGLAGVGAGQCHRNPVEGIFSRDLFSYINLQNPSILLSRSILSSPYPIVFSFTIGSGIQVPGPPVGQANLCITPSLFPIYFDHSLFVMGVIEAILTASKLVASLSQTATNGTAFIIFPSQEEFEIDVQP